MWVDEARRLSESENIKDFPYRIRRQFNRRRISKVEKKVNSIIRIHALNGEKKATIDVGDLVRDFFTYKSDEEFHVIKRHLKTMLLDWFKDSGFKVELDRYYFSISVYWGK